MRKLQTKDLFSALRLVQKSGLKEELIPVIEKISKEPDQLERGGILGILTLIEVFSDNKCEALFYEWLAGPFECTPKAVSQMELNELIDKLTELVEANDFRYFFTQFSQLVTTKH